MDRIAIYQTLQDRNNPDVIEDRGPFLCHRNNAWLGNGYYFWEHFIKNAHWWGVSGGEFKNGYVICKAVCDRDIDNCFDLVDNYSHLDMFNSAIDIMSSQALYTPNITTVARIIEHLRATLKIFRFEASRAYGIHTKSKHSPFTRHVIFDVRHQDKYLDSYPAIQVCLYNKSSLNISDYKIVYPDVYVDGYVC